MFFKSFRRSIWRKLRTTDANYIIPSIHRMKIGNLENYNPAECSQLRPLLLATTFYTRTLKWIRCFIEIEFLDEFYIIVLSHRWNKYDNIIFIDACHEEFCIFPFLFKNIKKILPSKTVIFDTRKYSFLYKRNKIFITIVSASSIKKISLSNTLFRYNPSDVTFKKITPPARSNIQHVSIINQEICKNVILLFYPPFLETSRSSHLTRTLFDSITVKSSSEIPPTGDQKIECGERRMEGVLVVENSYRAAFVPENRHKTRYRV